MPYRKRTEKEILRLLAPLGAALARGDGLSPKLCRSGPVPPAPTLSLSPQGTSLYALWNVGVTSCPHTCARSLQFGPFLLPPGVRRTMASARHDHSTLFHPFRWLEHTSLQSMPVMVFLGCTVLPNERQATLVAAHLPLYRLPETAIALQPGSLHDGKAEGSFCLLPNGNLLLTPMPSPESSLELALMAGAEPMAGVRPII